MMAPLKCEIQYPQICKTILETMIDFIINILFLRTVLTLGYQQNAILHHLFNFKHMVPSHMTNVRPHAVFSSFPDNPPNFDGFVQEREAAERKRKNEKKKKLKEKKKAPFPNVLSLLVHLYGLGRTGVGETMTDSMFSGKEPSTCRNLVCCLLECSNVISGDGT